MTLDEAANILNVQRTGIQAAEETELQKMLKVRPRLARFPLPATMLALRRAGLGAEFAAYRGARG